MTTAVLFFICIRMTISCGTIIHGETQDIEVRSNPDDAEVWVDGVRIGKTPTRLTLRRKDSHVIKIAKGDYKDAEIKITNETSGWLMGNIIFGGLLGCGVDLITGGAYDLKPEMLDINLVKVMALNGGTINIPQSDLDKIKQIDFSDGQGRVLASVSLVWQD